MELVWHAFADMAGGEIYVKKIPSMKVTDLSHALCCAKGATGDCGYLALARNLPEQMIGAEDAYFTYEYPEHYKILPQINDWDKDVNRIKDGIKVPDGFVYSSDNNAEWMSDVELKAWIDAQSR